MRPSPWTRNRLVSRRAITFLALAVVAAVAMISGVLLPPAPPLTGHAEIIDGDTLRIGSARVRLLGLDAPELDQTCTDPAGAEWACGMEAKRFAIGLVHDAPVTCQRTGRDRYGRALAKCSAGGADLGQAIVAAGWAVADFGYAAEEAAARAAKLGIWAGSFAAPAEWRRTHGTEQPGIWEWIRGWFG